jgi:hypothetical protein
MSRNAIEHAVIMVPPEQEITPDCLPRTRKQSGRKLLPGMEHADFERMEISPIISALKTFGGTRQGL